MGIKKESLIAAAALQTVQITVLVKFMDQSEGDFKGTFKRLPQDRLNQLGDPEAGYTMAEVVEEALVGVSGITSDGVELPPDEQLALVMQTPECVNAAFAAFFKAMRPVRYDEKTSKKRR